MTSRLHVFQLFILMALFSLIPVASVIFTPAYPLLSKEFQLLDSEAQWVMTLYLLGTAIGRLFYGPVANSIGRKNTLFLGLSISLAGTLIILFSQSYTLVCIGRMVQAFGGAATLKVGYTIIGDLYSGAAATRILSYAWLGFAIMPGIGTLISGLLADSFGWRGGFFIILLYTLFVMFLCFFLPETLKEKDKSSLNVKRVIHAYRRQFGNISLILWGTLMGLSTAVIYMFSQEAPFIAINQLGLTYAEYGMYYLIPSLGIAFGLLLTAWLSDKINSMTSMLWGIITISIASILMGIFFSGVWENTWALFLPLIIILIGDSLLFTNASSKGVTDATDKSNASAVMLFINSCVGFFGTFLIGVIAPGAILAMPVAFLLVSAILFSIWFYLHRKEKAA